MHGGFSACRASLSAIAWQVEKSAKAFSQTTFGKREGLLNFDSTAPFQFLMKGGGLLCANEKEALEP